MIFSNPFKKNTSIKPLIIHEDEHFIIINKPAGLVVHADGRTKEETLVDFLVAKYPEIEKIGEPLILKKKATVEEDGEMVEKIIEEAIARPGIVHRLDRETTGVMVIARTQKMFDNLKTQFKNKRTRKVYHALAYGHFKEDRGRVDRAMGRSRKDFRKWATLAIRGLKRPAQTDFRIMKQGYDENNVKISLVEARPLTGRTHQIRVHMTAIGHPIIGDTLYGAKTVQGISLGMDRCALHALELSFHDYEGNFKTFKAMYPQDFNDAVEHIVEQSNI